MATEIISPTYDDAVWAVDNKMQAIRNNAIAEFKTTAEYSEEHGCYVASSLTSDSKFIRWHAAYHDIKKVGDDLHISTICFQQEMSEYVDSKINEFLADFGFDNEKALHDYNELLSAEKCPIQIKTDIHGYYYSSYFNYDVLAPVYLQYWIIMLKKPFIENFAMRYRRYNLDD